VADRVVLREPIPDDRDEFLELVAVSRTLHRPWVYPPADRTAYRAWLQRNHRDDVATLLICRCEGGIVGVATLSQIVRGAYQSAMLGYYAFAPSAGQGLMTEGIKAVVTHAFDQLALHRVEANIQPENQRSIALARRCGFSREGLSPRYLKIGGRWRDHERWAVLAEEWNGSYQRR
jgi:[ribosomal protein S5]-alanine N-acetyltransferase